ncbi:hypothetical protein RhiirA5_429276 [Rhizophagus irregularis]|uniref:Uncharacterized protein n=1 Tax=Rhizophagus irregularis TaxID=588596 RepID=A0A2N0NYT6_9GLOM|nr:hypothetical protein RhiirA5_429276 [Rhizophagus irregularis]CAB5147429.1 unnamed protein product [Rhizophagus irregularis]
MFNFNKQCLEKDAASSTYSKKLKRNHNHDDDTATTLTGSETTAGTTIIINSRPSHSTTPDSSTSPSTHTSRRLNAPIIEVENPIDEQRCIMSNYHPNKWEEILVKQNKNIQEILVKQGKQIRVLYELQKSTNEKLTWVQNQLKSQPNKKDDIDLDQKVFMEGYSQLCRSFFPDNLWPNFNDYKVGLENWLNKNHPNYLKELGEQKWTNLFTRQHHSMLLRKMKDLRGTYAATVRNSIFKELRLQIPNNRKKSFSTISRDDESYKGVYIYMVAVCNIILNPGYPDIECAKKPLERRLQKFKELLTNNGSIELSDSASVMQEEASETMKKKKDEEEEGDVNAEDKEERDREQYFDALFEEN